MADSRAYRFAFLVRNHCEMPSDFRDCANSEEFEIGLFLPQDHTDRFAQPKYIPHLLLLQGTELRILPHPAHEQKSGSIFLPDIMVIERAQFLLSAWVVLATRHAHLKLPYPRREEGPVLAFLKSVIAKLPSYEFAANLSSADSGPQPGKALRAVLAGEFISKEAPAIQWSRSSPRNGRFDLLAITNRRLIWLTNVSDSDQPEPFGHRACCVPIHHLEILRKDADRIRVLLGQTEWAIPLNSPDEAAGASAFASASEILLEKRTAQRTGIVAE
jgi:hypothetical protein